MENMVEYFPEYLQIETIAGKCSANCIMCNIKESPRKGEMTVTQYREILRKFQPFQDRLKYLNLQGLGETLLDSTIFTKINIAKKMGFKGVGFATNATHLGVIERAYLLELGLDTIIFSIDGIKPETHENIRKVNYEKVLKNIMKFIEERNKRGKTKIIMRMIRQELNKDEWNEYREFWQKTLNPKFDDQVACYDVWGQDIEDKRKERLKRLKKYEKKKEICPDLLRRMLLFVNGDVILCCGNMKVMGNVLKSSPEDIYNGPYFNWYRSMMEAGSITKIDECKNCQVILSSMDKIYVDAKGE